MTKILFWRLEGALARRDATGWRLADGAHGVLRGLAGEGWSHVAVGASASALGARLGLADSIATFHDSEALAEAIAASSPFDEAFVIGVDVAADVLAAREAILPSILIGDASPLAQFSVETLAEIPLALATWREMRRSFFV